MKHNDRAAVRRPSVFKLFFRGALLRCPWCGSGGLMKSWFHLRSHCPRCRLRTERGEEDFFLGAMVFNIAISEGLLAGLMVAVMLATWPNVPWNLLWFGGIALMIAAPIAFYPVSKTLWMAAELLIRPLSPEELHWHRESEASVFRRQQER
jgi:uncharacterized protein (DUF983 family)